MTDKKNIVVKALRDCKVSNKEFSYKFNAGETKEVPKAHADVLIKTKYVQLVK